ncbi:DUF1801 domain-containing protein [Lysobacter hankyongensis]|uniref:DUF1801 domain-containing protein n=1 Tax=Lysobacter hankyongensis TaxID=1176535 RepID=A0ABP9BJA2_9GAMM
MTPRIDDDKVQGLLQDLRITHPDLHAIVQAVRALAHDATPQCTERVMYGGILFAAPAQYCGVFAYSAHVSVEFGKGAELDDPHGVLEGNGKFRRHIKLSTLDDIASKHLKHYIAQAHRLAAEPSQ